MASAVRLVMVRNSTDYEYKSVSGLLDMLGKVGISSEMLQEAKAALDSEGWEALREIPLSEEQLDFVRAKLKGQAIDRPGVIAAHVAGRVSLRRHQREEAGGRATHALAWRWFTRLGFNQI